MANYASSWPWKEVEPPVARGAFVLVEGLDRAGKTTQVERLCNELYSLGHNVKTLRFPGNNTLLSPSCGSLRLESWLTEPETDRTSPIGQMIDGYLRRSVQMDDHAIHLLFSANRWEKAQVSLRLPSRFN